MSSTTARASGSIISDTRARSFGIFFILLALAIAWFFGAGAEGGVESTFGLNGRDQAFELPQLVMPSAATAYLLAGVCAFLGAVQLTRGFGRKVYVVLGLAVACFIFAFLVWAARDGSLNLLGMLQSTLLRS